ncbi:MAG TPA: hypothetical protein VE244_04325 [Nitrososphaeraceae archaeon]|nr:hypothetical protein [Nitrososphaeraceae archaeon]
MIDYYQAQKGEDTDPYTMFVYAISSHTKESYFRRLRRFFDAIELCKGMRMEERCNTSVYRARTGYNWVFSNILRFLQSQKERVERKDDNLLIIVH